MQRDDHSVGLFSLDSMKHIIALVLTTLVLATAFAVSIPDPPMFPDSPTTDNCNIFAQQYQAYVYSLQQQLSTCIKRGPEAIQIVTLPDGRKRSTAYPDCEDLDFYSDKAMDDEIKAVGKCFVLAQENEINSKQSEVHLDVYLEKARELRDSIEKTRTLISNPDSFFSEALHDTLQEDLLERDNYALGNEVYKYAHDYVTKSRSKLDPVTDPLAQKVSGEALNKLIDLHSHLLRSTDILVSNYKDFDPEKPLQTGSESASDANGSARAILQDYKKCAELEENNPDLLIKLVKQCEDSKP